MEKLDLQTPNFTDQNVEKIASLFPSCVTESSDEKGRLRKSIDFDLLKQELSDNIVDGQQERYQINWPGKREALVAANTPINKTLRPCDEESVDFDATKNLFIEGDNLEALKLLQESYLNKVKMIYIDPPYNTGKDFVYKDDFTADKKKYELNSEQRDEEGGRLVANPETNGRYHSDWLSMIYPRIKLARNLLTSDGAIFISIDDNEVHSLRKICDEVFGEENFVNLISLNAKVSAGASGGGEDRKLKKNIEYILVYCKNYTQWEPIVPVYKETQLVDYIQQMKKDNKSFKYTNVLYKCEDINYYKTIKAGNNDDIVISKVNDYEIKTVKQISVIEGIPEAEVYKKHFDKIMTTTNAQTSIRERVWKETDSDNNMYIAEYIPKSGKNKGVSTQLFFMGKQKVLMIWLRDTAVKINNNIFKREKVGTFWDGFSWINVTKEGNIKFQNGKKPVDLIQQFMRLIPNNKNMTVLDFFAGSATTAHAVLQYNSEDNGNRRFILAQIPEAIEANTKDNKDYLKYLEQEGIKPIVTEIGKERIRRAGKKVSEGVESLDIGFRVLKVDSSNMNNIYYSPDELSRDLLSRSEKNIKGGRTPEDLLFQVLLDWGVDLSLPIAKEEIEGKTVYFVDDNALAACFDDGIDEALVTALAKREVMRVVFKDTGFAKDEIKDNVEQIFKQLSPETEVRAI